MASELVFLDREKFLPVQDFVEEKEVVVLDLLKLAELQADDEAYELEDDPTTLDESYLKQFRRAIPVQLLERGVSEGTAKLFGVRTDVYGMRIVMPVRNIGGTLIGVIFRQIYDRPDTPKYWYHDFKRSKVLFGMYEQIDRLRSDDCPGVIVVEGPIDAMCLVGALPYASVAVLGSAISNWQAELLRLQCFGKEVIVIADGDEAGEDLVESCRRKLGWFVETSTVVLPNDEDPASLGADTILNLIEQKLPLR